MILIGQYDSPFVRRVAIALRHYDVPFEHRPLSVWANAEEVAQFNPLRRVPVLILPDGLALVESFAILDELDRRAPDERVLLPRQGPLRTRGLRTAALATGFADKAVSLFYERMLHGDPSPVWIARCTAQLFDTLTVLERELVATGTRFILGDSLSHADIAIACVLRFATEALPGHFAPERWPALFDLARRCEEREVFREIQQPFVIARS